VLQFWTTHLADEQIDDLVDDALQYFQERIILMVLKECI
jgi:hypothetical protein